jgi:hypothetical protein
MLSQKCKLCGSPIELDTTTNETKVFDDVVYKSMSPKNVLPNMP